MSVFKIFPLMHIFLFLFFRVPVHQHECGWSVQVMMHTIADHSASVLGCRRSPPSNYRVVSYPTTHHPTQFDRLVYKHMATDVRASGAFRSGDVVTFVDGVLTKKPTQREILSFEALALLDSNWFLIPDLFRHGRDIPERGRGLGQCVRSVRRLDATNCVFSYLVDDRDRVWLRCRESNEMHFVRGIGVLATKTIEPRSYVRSSNLLIRVHSFSALDRSRLTALRSLVSSSPSPSNHLRAFVTSQVDQGKTNAHSTSDSIAVIIPKSIVHNSNNLESFESQQFNNNDYNYSNRNNNSSGNITALPQYDGFQNNDHDSTQHFNNNFNNQDFSFDFIDPFIANDSKINSTILHDPSQYSNANIVSTAPIPLPLSESTLLLIRNFKRKTIVSDGESEKQKKRRLVVLDDDISSEEGELLVPPFDLSGPINTWNFGGIQGLNIVRGVPNLAQCVSRFSSHFFEPESFLPKSGLVWADLFGQDPHAVTFLDPCTGTPCEEYRKSARAVVPVLDWANGARSFGFPFPDLARGDLAALEEVVLTSVMENLGYSTTGVQMRIEGLSFLIQTPACGIAQVIHTDDDPCSDPGEWISILVPCHTQKCTVFFQNATSGIFEKHLGVKPLLNLGDVAAFNKVAHMGSSVEMTPSSNKLRVCLFFLVHVLPEVDTRTRGSNPDSEFVNANRNIDDDEIIHYGPDVNFWRSGLIPIIRTCCVCLHGVGSEFTPFAGNAIACLENRLLYCSLCVSANKVDPVEGLVCEWCVTSSGLNVFEKYPGLDCTSANASVSEYVYQSLINERTCLHDSSHFKQLETMDYMFVLFSMDELKRGCQFWIKFYNSFDFTTEHAPKSLFDCDSKLMWPKFWDFMLVNKECFRARILCWVSALLGGISYVLCLRTKLSFGKYPVYYNHSQIKSVSSSNAVIKSMASFKNFCSGTFNGARLEKVTRRVHRFLKNYASDMTLRCTCGDYGRAFEEGKPYNHHAIETCHGPIMISFFSAEDDARKSNNDFVQRCRQRFADTEVQ